MNDKWQLLIFLWEGRHNDCSKNYHYVWHYVYNSDCVATRLWWTVNLLWHWLSEAADNDHGDVDM